MHAPEQLEIRQLLAADLSATLNQGILTITDLSVSGENNSLSVSTTETDLIVSDTNQQFIAAPAGGSLSVDGKTLTIPLSLITSGLTINAGLGDDQLTIESIDAGFNANLVLNGDAGSDSVAFDGDSVNVGTGSVTVAVETIHIDAALSAGGAINLTSTGNDTLLLIDAPVTAGADSTFAADKMQINSNVSVGVHTLILAPEDSADTNDAINIGIETDASANTLELSNAELDRIQAGTLGIGDHKASTITISAAIQVAGDEDISVFTGRNIVFVDGSGWETVDGNLSFSGNSADTDTENFIGLDINHATLRSTGTGTIMLLGTGGTGGSSNIGISLHNGSVLESSGFGQIILGGFGGTGTDQSVGVRISDPGTKIVSDTGIIQISGYGGSGDFGYGVSILNGAAISSVLNGPVGNSTNFAPIKIDGTGGNGKNSSGIFIHGGSQHTLISSVDAKITLKGTGGNSADGQSTHGVAINSGAEVRSTGEANISITGTGGSSVNGSGGVIIGGNGGALVTSNEGDIQITGLGGTSVSSVGVRIYDGGEVKTTGIAKININGTGGNGDNSNGVQIGNGSGARVETFIGDISITGRGGDTLLGSATRGVEIFNQGVVTSHGTAKITINGTGGSSTGDSRGVEIGGTEISGSGGFVASVDGDIQITGQGGNNAFAYGVWVLDGGVVQSTGIAKIAIHGTGGDGDEGNGVVVGGRTPARVTSVNGDISITGQGGDTQLGIATRGVNVFSGGVVESTGAANISILGTGGSAEHSSRGVEIGDAGTRITSTTGDIQITGQGGSNTYGFGVWVQSGAAVESTNTAKILIDGTAGAGGDINTGVALNGYGHPGATRIASVNGDIIIHGHGGDTITGYGAVGVGLYEGAKIQSTGTAQIILDGTGGISVHSSKGVEIRDAGTEITSAIGDIQLIGKGAPDYNGIGVFLHSGAAVNSTGIAKISIDGTGGDGSTDGSGVLLNGLFTSGATQINSVNGDITIIGRGGNSLTNRNSPGIGIYTGSKIQSTGSAKIVINGTGGSATDAGSNGNPNDPNTGNFNGIDMDAQGQVISSGSGDISLTGRGGAVGVNNIGIFAHGGSTIQSTGTGQITLNGTGGTGLADARGLQINDATISSVAGDIHLIGQGGATSNQANIGVWLVLGATVTASGSARITINGTGGGGTDSNMGVVLNGFGYGGATQVTTVDGDITINGFGSTSATGVSNRGLAVLEGATIASTGLGKIKLAGTAGTGTDGERGLEIGDTNTRISAHNGDLSLTGLGGTGVYGFGVWIRSSAVVESTGTSKITINGTGGTNGGEQNGVVVNGYGTGGPTQIRSVDGDILITGHGGNSMGHSTDRGFGMYEGATIVSTGIAKITIDATAGSGFDNERGVEIGDSGTKISSVQGDISITGRGGSGTSTSGTYNAGVYIRDSAVIESTATTGTAAKITIDGTAGTGSGADIGLWIKSSAKVSSVVGDIQLNGHGASGIGVYNFGVGLQESASVVSGGSAKIIVNGTGGNGAAQGQGVFLDSNSAIRSINGDIGITGLAGSGGDLNLGVVVQAAAVIESTGLAKITVDGTAGQGTDGNVGVRVLNPGSAIRSVNGDVLIVGRGGSSTGIFAHGVDIVESGVIVSTGTAKITVNGTAAAAAGRSVGTYVQGVGSKIQSVNGNIQITGQGGSVGDSNIGVGVQEGGLVESTGTATITVDGTGGSGASTNFGVRIYGADAIVRSAVGDIQVTGIGGSGTTFNAGVDLQLGGSIVSTGTAKINVTGTGGGGSFAPDAGVGQVGVWVLNANSKIVSKDGDITIVGIGGGDAGSSGNHGVMLQSGIIQTTAGGTANVSLTGTAGVGSTSFGINMNSDSANVGVNTSAGSGDITLVSDRINIDFVSQPAAVSAGANSVTIRPKTSGTPINLGGIDSISTLGLSDGEVDRITAATLTIGDDSGGAIAVSADLTRPTSTNLRLVGGGDIVIDGGQINTNGGTLAIDPGVSPNFTFSPLHDGIDSTASLVTVDGALTIVINGTQADTLYTQFNVAGGLDLTGTSLILQGVYTPAVNDSFVIVNNDGTDAITGQFQGLAEGQLVSFKGQDLRISYVGGDGNDVVLTAINIAPVSTDLSISTAEDAPYSGTLEAHDTGSSVLTYSLVSNPSHGTVTITNPLTGAYVYTPAANYNGPDSFTFKASDGSLDSNVATVSITVESVNDAPQLALNGGPVTFSAKAAKKNGPVVVLPNVTVTDPDQSAEFGVGGGTLNLSITVSGKQTKRKLKLDDTIGGISNVSQLGTATAPTFSSGKLSLTVHLNANATTADIQSFLRTITFSTKVPGQRLTPRAVQVQLTDAAGVTSNLLEQMINVTK